MILDFLASALNPTVGESGISYMVWIWLGILVLTILIEVFTLDMTSIWFALASLIAMVLAFFPIIGWEIQLVIFFAVAVISMIALRPLAKKYLSRSSEGKTNMDTIIGREVLMITSCDRNNLGSVKIGDVIWSVKTADDSAIAEGVEVLVTGVSGNKLIVKLVETNK